MVFPPFVYAQTELERAPSTHASGQQADGQQALHCKHGAEKRRKTISRRLVMQAGMLCSSSSSSCKHDA